MHFFPLGTNRDRGGPQRAFFDLFRAFAYMNVIKTFICPYLCGHVLLFELRIFMPAGSVLRTPGLESSCCILSHGPPDFLSCGEKATKSAAPIDTVSVSGFWRFFWSCRRRGRWCNIIVMKHVTKQVMKHLMKHVGVVGYYDFTLVNKCLMYRNNICW